MKLADSRFSFTISRGLHGWLYHVDFNKSIGPVLHVLDLALRICIPLHGPVLWYSICGPPSSKAKKVAVDDSPQVDELTANKVMGKIWKWA